MKLSNWDWITRLRKSPFRLPFSKFHCSSDLCKILFWSFGWMKSFISLNEFNPLHLSGNVNSLTIYKSFKADCNTGVPIFFYDLLKLYFALSRQKKWIFLTLNSLLSHPKRVKFSFKLTSERLKAKSQNSEWYVIPKTKILKRQNWKVRNLFKL